MEVQIIAIKVTLYKNGNPCTNKGYFTGRVGLLKRKVKWLPHLKKFPRSEARNPQWRPVLWLLKVLLFHWCLTIYCVSLNTRDTMYFVSVFLEWLSWAFFVSPRKWETMLNTQTSRNHLWDTGSIQIYSVFSVRVTYWGCMNTCLKIVC